MHEQCMTILCSLCWVKAFWTTHLKTRAPPSKPCLAHGRTLGMQALEYLRSWADWPQTRCLVKGPWSVAIGIPIGDPTRNSCFEQWYVTLLSPCDTSMQNLIKLSSSELESPRRGSNTIARWVGRTHRGTIYISLSECWDRSVTLAFLMNHGLCSAMEWGPWKAIATCPEVGGLYRSCSLSVAPGSRTRHVQ